MQQDLWKLGIHTGDEKTLRSRYITAIPDLVIAAMYHHSEAKKIEKFIKDKFVNLRISNNEGNPSEYFHVPFGALDMVIKALMIIFDKHGDELCVPKKKTKKRKRGFHQCDKKSETNQNHLISGVSLQAQTDPLPVFPDSGLEIVVSSVEKPMQQTFEDDYISHIQQQGLQQIPVGLLRFLYKLWSAESDMVLSSEDIMQCTCDAEESTKKRTNRRSYLLNLIKRNSEGTEWVRGVNTRRGKRGPAVETLRVSNSLAKRLLMRSCQERTQT
jgi:hypothetical protein